MAEEIFGLAVLGVLPVSDDIGPSAKAGQESQASVSQLWLYLVDFFFFHLR